MSREDFRVVRASEDCPAILFLNSNKSEQNIHRIVAQAREKCQSAGTALKHEVIAASPFRRASKRGPLGAKPNHHLKWWLMT